MNLLDLKRSIEHWRSNKNIKTFHQNYFWKLIFSGLLIVGFFPPIQAQDIRLDPPGRLSVCATETIRLHITAGTEALEGATLQIEMPCGFHYVPGSASEVEEDVSDTENPVFAIADLEAGQERELVLEVEINCSTRECIDDGELFYFGFTLTQEDESTEILSEPFNVETGNLVIVRIDTLVMQGALHQSITRRFTIRNTRLGRISSFTFMDEYSDQLEITNMTGQTLVDEPGLIVTELNANHFRQVGNQDDYLDFGEEVVIEQTIHIIACAYEGRFAASRWTVDWGCGGESCASTVMQGTVNIRQVNIPGDVLSFTPTRTEPNCYYGGTAEQRLRFNWSNHPLEIADLVIDIFSSQSGRGIVEGSIVASWADTVIYHNVSMNDCGQMVADRVSLRLGELRLFEPGSNRNLTWDVGFCHQEYESGSLTEHAWRYQYRYEKLCVNPEDQFYSTDRIDVGSFGVPLLDFEFKFPDFGGAAISEGTIFTMTAQVKSSRLGNSTGKLELILEKPKFIQLQGTDFSLGGKLPLDIEIIEEGNDEIITLTYALPLNSNSVTLGLPSQITCDLFEDAPCYPIVETSCENRCPVWADSKSISSRAKLIFSDDCETELNPVRTSSDRAGFDCWSGTCEEEMPAYLDYTFEIKRTSLGLPDKNNNGIPDEDGIFDYDQLELDHMIPGDTFEIRIAGEVVVDEPGRGVEYAGWLLSVDDVQHSLSNGNHSSHEIFTEFMLGHERGIYEIEYKVEIFNKDEEKWHLFNFVPRLERRPLGYIFFDLNVSKLKEINPEFPQEFLFTDGDSVIIISKNIVRKNLTRTNGGPVLHGTFNKTLSNLMRLSYESEFILADTVIIPKKYYHKCNCKIESIRISGYSNDNNIYGGLTKIIPSTCLEMSSQRLLNNIILFEGFSGSSRGEIRQKRVPRKVEVNAPPGLNIEKLFFAKSLYGTFSEATLESESDTIAIFKLLDSLDFDNKSYRFRLSLETSTTTCFEAINEFADIRLTVIYDIYGPEDIYPKYTELNYRRRTQIPNPTLNLTSNYHYENLKNIKYEFVLSNPNTSGATWANRTVSSNLVFLNIETNNTSGNIITGLENNDSNKFLSSLNNTFFIDSIDRNQSLPLTLHATSTSCQPEQIIIEYGYDCDLWTDPAREPCFLARDTITIEVLHGLMDMQTEEEARDAGLCTDIGTQTLYFNADLGHAYDLHAEVLLPRGMSMVPGSAVLVYPAGSDNEMVIGDPELLTGRHYRWWMDDWMPDWIEEGLPGVETIPGNDFEIRFDVLTDCDFISGTRIIHTITGHKVCGLRTNRRAKVEGPIHIEDVDQPYSMNLQANTQGSAVCGNEMSLHAQLNIPAGEMAKIYLSLAPGMSYVAGSASASVELINEQEDGNIWSWELMDADGATSFSASFISTGECQDAIIEVFATAEAEALCVDTQVPCTIEVVTGSRLLPIRIEKPVYDFTQVEMLLPEEPGQGVRLKVALQHSGVLSPEQVTLNLYRDIKGNGQIDGDDIFVKSFQIGPFESEEEIREIILDLPEWSAADYCGLLLELNEAENCVCEGLVRRVGGAVRLLAADLDLCHDETTTIGVNQTPGHSYQWNTDVGMSCTQCPESSFFIPNESIFQEEYERILTEVTDEGCTIEHHFSLQVHPRTEILSGDQLVCAGEEIELIANTAQSYHWTGDNIQQNGMQILRVQPRVSGYYYLEALGLEQCDSRDSVFVEVLPAPTEQFPDGLQFCYGGTSIIDIQPEEGVRYEWQNGEDRLSAIDIANPEVLIEEPFTFILSAENPVCRTVSEIEVSFFTAFEIEGLPESLEICIGDTIYLNLSGGISYEWSEDVSDFCVDQDCENLIIPVDFEQWQLSVLARDEEGCVSTAEMILFGTRDTLLHEESLLICEGEEVELFGQWINEAGYYCDTTRIAGECLRVDCIDLRLLALDEIEKEAQICRGETYDFLNDQLSESGLYCYDFINQDGCDSTICLDLRVYELPLIELQTFYSAMEGDIIQLNLPAHYESYQWEPAHLFDCADCPEVNITASQSGTYEVWVTDSTGCQSYHAFQLEVIIPCEAINAKLPNAFTPNDDGINDSYHIQGLEYCGPAELIVFNRWGNEVYRQRDYDNNWRGQSSNGEELPQGTYFVVLEYKEYGIIKQGMVDLRRR